MKSYNPTTPSRRSMTNVDYKGLSKVRSHKPLLTRLTSNSGRNSQGRITVRHQGGGNKKLYRMVDFIQRELDQPARILTIEYDPYRTAFICLISHKNGKKSYILAPHGITVGTEIITSETAPLTPGNRLKLKNIPIGSLIHNVEMHPGKGGQMARSAGSYAEILANADGFTDLKLSSSEVRRVPWECFASIGQVSNIEHNLTVIGKAGRSRWLGIRPTTRAKAMNPVDHPYGGGEGSTQRGTRKPKTLWGKITGGHKTRNKKKPSTKFIVSRRK